MGKMYLNIGNEKSSLFLPASLLLVGVFRRLPMVFDAMEEATQSAERGYYSAGIVAFTQALHQFKVEAQEERHDVAHRLLEVKPTRKGYDRLHKLLEDAADRQQAKELARFAGADEYYEKLSDAIDQWRDSLEGK